MKKRSSLAAALLLFCAALSAQIIDYHLKVDQFGYLPDAAKIAVIADPQVGFNAAETYTPGATLELRRASDNTSVFSAAPTSWKNGATDVLSGDRAWWFDFSSVTAPGEYYVFDPANNTRSEAFRIAPQVYDDLLRTAVRTFYYQRCGAAKPAQFAGEKWADATACHVGANQDVQCRLHSSPSIANQRDLSGGWHDAGDYNKYVNFALAPVLDLLLAYQEQPLAFTDDYGIPESSNGTPDLLDEIKWQLDWLLKMQEDNGSVLCIIGGGYGSPASADANVRRYGPATTSASYSAAAMFALGAEVFGQAGFLAYANTLQTAAVSAYTWAAAHPGVQFSNTGVLAAGEQEVDAYGLFISRLCAAIYLYDLTGDPAYRTWVEANYAQHHLLLWTWASMYEVPSMDALLRFSALPGVTASVANTIRNTYQSSLSNSDDYLGGFAKQLDPYRTYLSASNYTWGSNRTKSSIGIAMLNMQTYGLNAAQHQQFRNAAAGHLHYLHGVNPLGMCYLTNMGTLGAGNSAREMYHSWFGDGTAWDNAVTSPKGPAPGFLTGGANRYFALDGCCPSNCGSAQNNALCTAGTFAPPLNQPAAKSYKDWNTSWPQNSWQITENSISYQAAYIRLLSKFARQITTPTHEAAARAVQFTLSPNPAHQTCLLQLENADASDVYVRLISANGQTCQEARLSGTTAHLFDLSGVPAGVYFVQVTGGAVAAVQQLVVER